MSGEKMQAPVMQEAIVRHKWWKSQPLGGGAATYPRNVDESNPMPAVPTVTWVVAMGLLGVPMQVPWCTGQVLVEEE